MSDAIFTPDGDRYVTSPHARGPWDPGQQHGGAPAALLAEHVVRAEPGAAEMVVARLTYDFLGPVPVAPVRASARVVRPGRRLQLVEAELADDEGRILVRARGVRLARGAVELPAATHATAAAPAPAGPDDAVPAPFPLEAGEHPEGFHRTAMEIRFGDGTSYGPGPAHAWFRLRMPLVAGEAPSPVARAAAAADFGNGVSRVLGFDAFLFVNTDLTLHLHREPVGEWVLLDARTRVEPVGTGLAWSALSDRGGPIGLSAQSLFVAARPRGG